MSNTTGTTGHNSKMNTSMRVSSVCRRGYTGILMVFCLMAITLYMAFAFPYTLFHLKQTETTEIKAVIIVGRGGERSPTPESYFVDEDPPEELHSYGYEQLTNTGKERMYLLGKFLKLRYYHLLLNGDPRMVTVRSADSDSSLESAQALLAGLNPPKDSWIWSSTGELTNWQPKAVHTTAAADDDLLSESPVCFRLDQDKLRWKNSSRYQQLLNEFRHDMQTLRANTGLEFEDDLEMLTNIEDALMTRKANKDNVPAWYTNTFANRLAHIADVSTESRFNSAEVQRLYVGRLLHEIAENINTKIRLNQQLLSLSTSDDLDSPEMATENTKNYKTTTQQPYRSSTGPSSLNSSLFNKPRFYNEPNMFVYITDKSRLSALMNSLQIYSSQPLFGSLLLIELHYDPINQLHFLRLFTVSSNNPNIFPEPLRVNPIACVDSVECAPQQFEQNIRHLMLDKASWLGACLNQPTTPPPAEPLVPLINDDLSNQPLQPQTTTFPPATTNSVTDLTNAITTTAGTTTQVTTTTPDDGHEVTLTPDELNGNLVVSPTNAVWPPQWIKPQQQGEEKGGDQLIWQQNGTTPETVISSSTSEQAKTDGESNPTTGLSLDDQALITTTPISQSSTTNTLTDKTTVEPASQLPDDQQPSGESSSTVDSATAQEVVNQLYSNHIGDWLTDDGDKSKTDDTVAYSVNKLEDKS